MADKANTKRPAEDDSDDDKPLVSLKTPSAAANPAAAAAAKPKPKAKDDSDDEVPLSALKSKEVKKEVKKEPSSQSKPAKKEVTKSPATPAAPAAKKVKQEPDSDDEPLAAKTPTAKKDAEDKKPAAKAATPAAKTPAADAKPKVVKVKEEAKEESKGNGKVAAKAAADTPAAKSKVKQESQSTPAPAAAAAAAAASASKDSAKKSAKKAAASPAKKRKSSKDESEDEEEDDDDESGDESDEDDSDEDGSDDDSSDGSEDDQDDDDDADKKKKGKKKQAAKKKPAKKKPAKKARAADSDDDDEKGSKAKSKRKSGEGTESGKKRKKKEEEEQEVWKWWLDPPMAEGQKWRTLKHKGPLFPPTYKPLPQGVHLLYNGHPLLLKPASEEIAGFFATMLHTDYAKKKIFCDNFFKCWRENMTAEERKKIVELEKCDFTIIQAHYQALSEAKKSATKEEKEERKRAEKAIQEEYGFCLIDGHRQKIGNYRIEPPGLFRGRGEHPKQGLLKVRVRPEDITINCGADDEPPHPPEGHKWKEVRHDNTVTWLAGWVENVQGQYKYVMLASESHLKGQNDMKKYETARKLKGCVDEIRRNYMAQLKSEMMYERQRATALYLIDKLALRAGNEKDADEEADTVGCCNLRVEHIKLVDDEKFTVEFDFLGKDSIRYFNRVNVEPQVYKNMRIFMRAPKTPEDDLFDRLNTAKLNAYLSSLMDGLTAKVFRTYNASITLQDQLKNTPVEGSVEEKVLAYNRANREVAVLCNHQRSAPKTHEVQMDKLGENIETLAKEIKDVKAQVKAAKSSGDKSLPQLQRKLATLETRLHKKEIAKTDKMENKTIALSTSKLNYLDPRISVSWCKRFDVPIEKVYNQTQRKKFRWAVEMAGPDFVF